jgi:prepilin-type N-terminal cleavage/methylation domain-containing protein
MSLTDIKNLKSEKGFTIVELLIVIVVIGILAAIVIVAYNGVQNSAKAQSSKSTAANVQKKIEAYNANKGNYPTDTSYSAFTTTLNSDPTSTLANTGITLGTPSNANTNTAGIYRCTAGGTGFDIVWYDYVAGSAIAAGSGIKINYSGACTTWTQLT